MLNMERAGYCEGTLNSLAENEPAIFRKTASQRILCAAGDIFQKNGNALGYFKSILETGRPDPAGFERLELQSNVLFIAHEKAHFVGEMLAHELLYLHQNRTAYFQENGLYRFWEVLKNAGMPDEQIGKYFEDFDECM